MSRHQLSILVIFSLFIFSDLMARETYIWEEKNQKPYTHFREKFYQQISFVATEYMRDKFEGVEYVYAGPNAFGLYNGQKLRVLDFKVYTTERGPDGFRPPTYPRTYKEINKVKVDSFDYHATVYIRVSDSGEEWSFPFEIGMNFICEEEGVLKECRKTKFSEFFDQQINFKSSDLTPFNNSKDIIGMFFDWRPHIRQVHLGITSINPPVHTINIFEEFKDRPDIIQAIRHRLVAPGMNKREVELAIGQGQLGIDPVFNRDGIVEKVIYDQYKRPRDILR